MCTPSAGGGSPGPAKYSAALKDFVKPQRIMGTSWDFNKESLKKQPGEDYSSWMARREADKAAFKASSAYVEKEGIGAYTNRLTTERNKYLGDWMRANPNLDPTTGLEKGAATTTAAAGAAGAATTTAAAIPASPDKMAARIKQKQAAKQTRASAGRGMLRIGR